MRRLVLSLILAVSAAVSADAQIHPIGDLNEDLTVDFHDFEMFAQQWLSDRCEDPGCEADLDGVNGVNEADFAIFARNWRAEGVGLLISEFMASNSGAKPPEEGGLLDKDGDSSDWIEIYNPTDKAFDLGGWYLTDNAGDLDKWEFPAGVVIGAKSFLVVFASGKDLTWPELHTNFQLNAGGGYLALVAKDGVTVVSDYNYPTQLPDISYGMSQLSKTFVAAGGIAAYSVPQAGDAGAQWTSTGFNDGDWNTANTPLGFAQVQTDVTDVTAPGDVVQGVPNDGDWPTNESPPLAIDDNINTKFLHFKGDFDPGDPPDGAGFQVAPGIGPSVVTGLTFRTANDAPERDPTAYALYGSNTSINGPYTMIATGEIVDFEQASPWPRFTKNTTPITFANDKVYTYYQVLFPAIRDASSAVAMQIGEVELLGSPASAAVSNVQQQMLNINSSLWTRMKFYVSPDDIDAFDVLSLRMKYDDGYIAYLNGQEVARRNFSGTPVWDSHSDTDRPDALADDYESVDVSDDMSLLNVGTNILAIQGLNNSVSDDSFLLLPELAGASSFGVQQYFTQATPGTFNVSGAVGVVKDTKFSVDRGFYDSPFTVEITADPPDAMIFYTTDGSMPSTNNGYVYMGPIQITHTTCLRAIAMKPGWLSTNVDTQTYIFINDVPNQPAAPTGFPTSWAGTAADYAMDQRVVTDPRYSSLMRDALLSIPTISIVTDVDNLFGSNGIYVNPLMEGAAWERPASIELINPDGSKGFQIDAGIRIYGGAFRRMDLTRKKTFRILFKRDYGASKLDFPLFGTEDATSKFDTIILRAGSNDGWNNWGGTNTQYIVDEYQRRTQRALGQVSGHGTFVHLYVDGLYWGLYNPVERPGPSFAATYYGGEKTDWDGNNAGVVVGESTLTTWNAMLSQIGQGMGSTEAYQRIQGNNPDGTNNPSYDDLLDVDNYVDYLFCNFWGGTGDWGGRNWYAACRRPPNATGFKFFNWDMEGAIVIWSNLNADVTNANGTIQGPYQALKQNADFRMLFADHTQRHMFNGGAGTAARAYARYKELADEVELAIIAESARWGDQAGGSPYTQADWKATRDYILNTYMPQRPAIVMNQLRGAGLYPTVSAPEFKVNGVTQHGGQIAAGDGISMVVPGGSSYIETELVGESANVRVHVPLDNSLGETWTGKSFVPDSSWTDGSTVTGVGYERGSGYENLIGTNVESQMYNQGTSVFARIQFSYDDQQFDNLILQMKYDDGFVAYINGVRVCTSPNVTNDVPGSATAGSHEAGAANEDLDITDFKNALVKGDNVLAIHGINISTTSSDMLVLPRLIMRSLDTSGASQPVLYTLDGSDPRLQGGDTNPAALSYAGSPVTLTESGLVKARTLYNGTWSALSEATFAVGPVAENLRISEIMYHPQSTGSPSDANEEYIELVNTGTEALNLNLVKLTNGVKFTFGGTVLGAGQYVLVVRDQAAFEARYGAGLNVAGQYEGSLDDAGERITLEDASGAVILSFKYNDDWYDMTDGDGFSLTIRDAAGTEPNLYSDKDSWRPSARIGGSPGGDDSGYLPEPGSVVINEVLAHSHAEAPDWIELHNTTDSPINIGGWYLSDSDADDPSRMKYRIADGTSIPAYGFVVFEEDVNFNNPSDPGSLIQFALSENGDLVVLSSADAGVLTGYRDREDFGASPVGVAFGRYHKSDGSYNFVLMSENTPGAVNSYPLVGPIVINEIMYNPPSGNQDAEYIELLNITSSAVTLYDSATSEPWKFTDGIEYTFPTTPLVVPAGGYVLIVPSKAAFESEFGAAPAGVPVFEYTSGNLNNGGEKLELSMPGDVDQYGVRQYIRVDRVNYSDGEHPLGEDPWPVEADGGGKSLSRIETTLYGNDVVNWSAQEPSPGLANPSQN